MLFELWNENKTIGVWVTEDTENGGSHPFRYFGITPSSNPGSGTRIETKEKAIEWAIDWFDRMVKAIANG
jgi:hypothetical protein